MLTRQDNRSRRQWQNVHTSARELKPRITIADHPKRQH